MISPRFIDDKHAEALSGIPRGTLRNWRCKGEGPRFVKLRKKVLYRVQDLEAWLEAHSVDPEYKEVGDGQ